MAPFCLIVAGDAIDVVHVGNINDLIAVSDVVAANIGACDDLDEGVGLAANIGIAVGTGVGHLVPDIVEPAAVAELAAVVVPVRRRTYWPETAVDHLAEAASVDAVYFIRDTGKWRLVLFLKICKIQNIFYPLRIPLFLNLILGNMQLCVSHTHGQCFGSAR